MKRALFVLLAIASCHKETRVDSQEHLVAAASSNSTSTEHAKEVEQTVVQQGPSRTIVEEFFPPAAEELEHVDAGVLPKRPSFYPPEHGALKSRTIIDTGPIMAASSSTAVSAAASASQTHERERVDSQEHQQTSVTVGPGWKFYIAAALVLCAAIYALYRWAPKIPWLQGKK